MKQAFLKKTARSVTTVRCECRADERLFGDWDNMPGKVKSEFKVNGPIPCAGSGLPGMWCESCRFGVVHEPQIEE